MTDRYAALREATADAMAVKWYFMFDNHSFLHLFADDVKASMATLRGLSAKRIAYGMLCAKGENRKHLHFHGSAENAEDLAAAEEWMQESATPKPKPEAKYYAAADPATIAELLKERDALKAESAALKAEGEHLREKWKLFPDPTLPVLNANPPPKREP